MILSKNGYYVEYYEPSYSGMNVIVSIDSSKSNSAMFVASSNGVILDDYEISGAGGDVDVYKLCWDTRKQLANLFRGAKVQLVGIEDIITKKGKHTGLETHQSRAKITAVFNSFIAYFQDHHDIMPVLVNNQAWKSYVLPEEYRTRAHDKGSKDWLYDIGSVYGERTDDICDAYCILQFLKGNYHISVIESVDNIDLRDVPYKFYVMPKLYGPEELMREFKYNPDFMLMDNIKTIANICSPGQNGFVKVPISLIPIDWIYEHTIMDPDLRFEKNASEVYLCIQRWEQWG